MVEDKMPEEPWTRPWPAEDLEYVHKCPVCKNTERRILLSGLVDNVFQTAPGKWSLYECLSCQSAYIDPRPTQESIGRAYAKYFTHISAKERKKESELHPIKLMQRALVNGYINSQYGTRYSPSSRMGKFLVRFFPSKRERLDAEFRWIPKPSPGQRLLDVGCGNGSFLVRARDAGWKVVGIDPDSEAIEITRTLGFEAYVGTIEGLKERLGQFDAITLNHVIEHLHCPQQTMATVYELLKPGGTIYLETPNIHSTGFALFTKNWRGLEAPRHVVIFSFLALEYLLKFCGFECVEYKYRKNVIRDMYLKSRRLLLGRSPYEFSPKFLPFWQELKIRVLKAKKSRSEFITLIARK